MSPILPLLNGREVVNIFETFGGQVVRQRGSHLVMIKAGETVTLSIQDHKEVARGTLRSLIRSAGLTVEVFLAAIR
jgi:predicted RNA binding protein YcfA (HicA-like mRNA interferase family)